MATKKTVAKKKTIRERLKDISDVIGAVTIIGTACVGVGTWCKTRKTFLSSLYDIIIV